MAGPIAVGIITVLIVAAVGAGVIAVSVMAADREAEATAAERRRDETRTTTDPATPTTDPTPLPLDGCLDQRHDAVEPLNARPAQPAPAAGQPGQHALLYMPDQPRAEGNLDLAPGGGFEAGHTPASDAKTVFVVCAITGPTIPTGITCDYIIEDTGEPWYPALHERSMVMVAFEARSGREVGRSEPIGLSDDPDCSEFTYHNDQDVVTVGTTDYEVAVTWVRDHLTGAVFTP